MSDITAVRRSMHWSAEAKEEVRALWLDGHSAGVIAKKLNATSRSAIIGLVHRMGLSRMRETKSRLFKPRGEGRWTKEKNVKTRKDVSSLRQKIKRGNGIGLGIRAPKPAQIDAAKAGWEALKKRIAAAPPPATAKSLLDLENDECRWPYGDGPYVFCGCKRALGSSYCADHAMLSNASQQRVEEYYNKVTQHTRAFGAQSFDVETNLSEINETVAA